MKIFFFFFKFGKLKFLEGIENFYFDFFFFFWKNLEILNFFKELKIWIFLFEESWIFSRNWKFWIFFERNLRSTSLMPLVPRPFLKFFFLFFFWNMKICSLSKKWRRWRWRWRWSKSDEDLFMMFFFFFFGWKTYPLNENNFGWKLMQIAKSLLNSCKKIISI